MKQKRQHPPRWLDRVLEFYCKSTLAEDLQGDLHEYYYRNLKKGRFRADLIYFLDVLKFFRPYTVRQPKLLNDMSSIHLTKNYFKTSVRSLKRHKLFSAINIVGLAVSMPIGILMITYFSELMTYEDFHEKKDRIYRVISHYKSITSDIDVASTSILLGQKLKSDYAGIEHLTIMRRGFSGDLVNDEGIISAEGLYADEEFFDVFTFPLLAGNSKTCLAQPYSLVISEDLARKLLKDREAVGETVRIGEKNYTITGVFKNLPTNSHLQFEVLASFATFVAEAQKEEQTGYLTWQSTWMNYIYMSLPEGQSIDLIQGHLDQIGQIENEKTDRYQINHELQSILDITPGPRLSNQPNRTILWKDIYQLLGLTIIVLLSACFNYTNLSIARSLRRAKEVAVRKVVGASTGQIFIQFIMEAAIIALIALFFAFGLYLLIKPEFKDMVLGNTGIQLNFGWYQLPYLILFALLTGVLAGSLPSLILSKLKAKAIFRDASATKLMKGLNLRKVLIVFQFALSMAFIIGATITYRQYKFAINYDLGFSTENILNIDLKENDAEKLLTEFQKIPEVTSKSRSSLVPSVGSYWASEIKYNDPLDSIEIAINHVDSAYLSLHNFKFLAGSTFPYDLKKDEQAKFIIIDEKLRKRLGIASPSDAIGEQITVLERGDYKLKVVGVIENYQYGTIQSVSDPTALFQGSSDKYRHINLKVQSTDMIGLMEKLEKAWRQVDLVHPFEATFYDDSIAEAYEDFLMMFEVFTFLAIVAVSIAAMGLLGMAVYTIETRIKEISVRKVMGASENQLVILLSRSFLLMLVIAAMIAIPSTYALFDMVMLNDYAHRISIGAQDLLPGVILICLLGLITISWQTKKAAKTNPSEMLRND